MGNGKFKSSQKLKKLTTKIVISTLLENRKRQGNETGKMATYPLSHGLDLSTPPKFLLASISSSLFSATSSTIQLNRTSGSLLRANPLSFCSFSFPCLVTNNGGNLSRIGPVSCHDVSTIPPNTTQYEFHDGSSDVELRLLLTGMGVQSSKEIHVDADARSLVVRVHRPDNIRSLLETEQLYERIKPSETIWYLDDDQLVINLRKQDPELQWPDIVESWESLNSGIVQLLKGTSIYLVGDSTKINQGVAQELAVGLGYTPLDTKSLLETFAKQSIDSWVAAEGPDSVAEAEQAVLESLSSHVRAVVATLGGKHGAAGNTDKWRHLNSGFTVWLLQSEASDGASAKEEARKQVYDGSEAYAKADVVVKLSGWDSAHAKSVAQASLSALKQLLLSDKKLPGNKSLYIRLGCRGDWPNIKPPGWDPSTGADAPTNL